MNIMGLKNKINYTNKIKKLLENNFEKKEYWNVINYFIRIEYGIRYVFIEYSGGNYYLYENTQDEDGKIIINKDKFKIISYKDIEIDFEKVYGEITEYIKNVDMKMRIKKIRDDFKEKN